MYHPTYTDTAIFWIVGFAQHTSFLYLAVAAGSIYGFIRGYHTLGWGKPAGAIYFVSGLEPDLHYRMFSQNTHVGIDKLLRMILFAMLLYHIDGNYHWQNYIFVRWLMGMIAVVIAFYGVLTGRYFGMALVSAVAWLSLEYQGIKWGTQEGKDYIVRTIRADKTVELFPVSREDRVRWEREVVAYTRDHMFLQGCFAALWLTAAIGARWWLTQPAAWLARDSGDFGSITLWLADHDGAFLLPWLLIRGAVKSVAFFLTMTMNQAIYYSGAQFVSGAMVKPKTSIFFQPPPGGPTMSGGIKAGFANLKKRST